MNAKELKTCAEWYDVDSIHASIQRQLKCGPITRMVESVPAAPPSDIGSREFAEWHARNLRLAMAKGMAFAQREKPKYRPPRPSDDGRWCFLEELPSDAPPTLVRSYKPLRYAPEIGAFEVAMDAEYVWQYWTVAGWRELTKGIWPCERPE